MTEIKNEWNADENRKAGVRKAFRQTLFSKKGERVPRLQKLLDEAEANHPLQITGFNSESH